MKLKKTLQCLEFKLANVSFSPDSFGESHTTEQIQGWEMVETQAGSVLGKGYKSNCKACTHKVIFDRGCCIQFTTKALFNHYLFLKDDCAETDTSF